MGASPIVAKELRLVGSFRFGPEFAHAVHALAEGVCVEPLLSATFELRDGVAVIEMTFRRGQAMKVQLAFGAS